MGGLDSVGTLLADIATLLADGLRILSLADKRHWGPDEREQVCALEEALDEARKDFQELSPLVHGQAHYEHDRKHESVEELRALRARFRSHIQSLKDWTRSGGPIDPVWVRDTHALQRDLHRAQCRAARRIFTSGQESSQRCLGAFLVRRVQRRGPGRRAAGPAVDDFRRRQLEELAVCTTIGGFERFGDEDMAFICDFCDGHLVWDDLETVPTPHAAAPPAWQATGTTLSGPRQKLVVSAPVAIANHMAPLHGDWQARLICPFCEDEAQQPQDEDDDDEAYRPDHEFDDVAALQEHLEWQHPAPTPPATLPVSLPSSTTCLIM